MSVSLNEIAKINLGKDVENFRLRKEGAKLQAENKLLKEQLGANPKGVKNGDNI